MRYRKFEKLLLQHFFENGIKATTQAKLADKFDISIFEAKNHLSEMVKNGYLTPFVNDSGTFITYHLNDTVSAPVQTIQPRYISLAKSVFALFSIDRPYYLLYISVVAIVLLASLGLSQL